MNWQLMIYFLINAISGANPSAETSVCGSWGHRIAVSSASDVDVEPFECKSECCFRERRLVNYSFLIIYFRFRHYLGIIMDIMTKLLYEIYHYCEVPICIMT